MQSATPKINSSIYSQYSHLKTPVSVGGVVYAQGSKGAVACEIVSLGADHLYVQAPGARLTVLLYPSNVRSTASDFA
jgi:hypothetical protein